MKFVLLHLNGTLDLSLANSFAMLLKERSSNPHTFLINFDSIIKIDENTISPLFEILRSIPSHTKFGLCVPSEHKETILALFPADSPIFPSVEAGKTYFESLQREKSSDGHYLRLTDYFRKGDNFYIYCPNCRVKLRIRSIGNHACPSCQIRFYFKPDLKKETQAEKSSGYEMLSLE